MRIVYKIYQTNFESDHEHDFFLKLDDEEYATIGDAEAALKLFLDSRQDNGEYTILPTYFRG